MVGYGSYSLWVIHKEGLVPSGGDINKLMMNTISIRLLRRPIWRSDRNTRLLRKRSLVRFPHNANICVHVHVFLYWVVLGVSMYNTKKNVYEYVFIRYQDSVTQAISAYFGLDIY
jgi:hypothetical protein